MHIKSYVLRKGRMSLKQRQALSTYWTEFGLEILPKEILDFSAIFNRVGEKLILEIGFGNGDVLVDMALRYPEYNFLGIEVYASGIGHLLQHIIEKKIQNIRIMQQDAVTLLRDNIADNVLDKVQIFFPDPWPKARHHKRRLIKPDFIELLARKIKTGGTLHMATDWENYAMQMLKVASAQAQFINCAGEGNFSLDKLDRLETKYERRGLKLGYKSWDLVFTKI